MLTYHDFAHAQFTLPDYKQNSKTFPSLKIHVDSLSYPILFGLGDELCSSGVLIKPSQPEYKENTISNKYVLTIAFGQIRPNKMRLNEKHYTSSPTGNNHLKIITMVARFMQETIILFSEYLSYDYASKSALAVLALNSNTCSPIRKQGVVLGFRLKTWGDAVIWKCKGHIRKERTSKLGTPSLAI